MFLDQVHRSMGGKTDSFNISVTVQIFVIEIWCLTMLSARVSSVMRGGMGLMVMLVAIGTEQAESQQSDVACTRARSRTWWQIEHGKGERSLRNACTQALQYTGYTMVTVMSPT